MLGMIIGLSFSVAMVLGPILGGFIGVQGIFWFTAVLALTGLVLLHTIVPNPKISFLHRDAEVVPGQFKAIIKNKELLRLDLGIFIQHASLTALFIVIPVILQNRLGLISAHQWYLYLPVLALAFMIAVPFIIVAEKKRKMKQVFIGAVLALALSQFGLYAFYRSIGDVAILLFVYFTAFTLLEATLPSLISKIAPAGNKGTAMGVYSSSQFFGIFFGGAMGGFLYGQHDLSSIFLFGTLLCLLWFFVALKMKTPPHLGTQVINLGSLNATNAEALRDRIMQITGVAEAVIIPEDGIAYLKVDNAVVDKTALAELAKATN